MANTTPDTAAFLFLGLAAIVIILGLFIASIVARYSSYRTELARIANSSKQ